MLLVELVLVVVALVAVAWLARDATKRRQKRVLQGQTARWEREQAELRRGLPTAAGPASGAPVVMESFTLGWLNMLVQSTWAPVLERLVSNIAAERLQLVLNEVLRKVGGNRRPWKYLESVSVEEVTFGLAPPSFQFANAKYDPARQHLQIQLNMRFNSSGFQAVLSPRVRQVGLLKAFSLRLEITQLLISGRLNLGIQLTSEAPGIKGVEYSFQQEPEFEIQVSPLGLSGMAGELPGLISNLRGLLLKAMSKKVVEPNRKYLDVQKIYRNKYVTKAGGPGGMVTVTVIGARNVGPPSSSEQQQQQSPARSPSAASARSPFEFAATPSSSSGTEEPDVDPFVEMRFGREVFRTPVVHRNATSPVWNWQLHLRLPAAIPGADGSQSTEPVLRDDRLRFSVLNAAPIGEPDVLCSCQVHMRDLGLTPNGDAVPLLLPLKGPNGQQRGTLQAQVRWLKAISKPKPFKANVVEPDMQQQQQQQQVPRLSDPVLPSQPGQPSHHTHTPHLPHVHSSPARPSHPHPHPHSTQQQPKTPLHSTTMPRQPAHTHAQHHAGPHFPDSQPGSPRGPQAGWQGVANEASPLRTPGADGPDAPKSRAAAPVTASRQSSGKSAGEGIARHSYSWVPWTSWRKASHTTQSSGSAGDSPMAPAGSSFSVKSSAHSSASLHQQGPDKATAGHPPTVLRQEQPHRVAAPLPPRVPYRLRWPLSSLHKRTASEMPATALESPLSPIGSRPSPQPLGRGLGTRQGMVERDAGRDALGTPRGRLFDDVVREGSDASEQQIAQAGSQALQSADGIAGGSSGVSSPAAQILHPQAFLQPQSKQVKGGQAEITADASSLPHGPDSGAGEGEDGMGELSVQLRTSSLMPVPADPQQRRRTLKRASTTSGAGAAAAAAADAAADAAIVAVLGAGPGANGQGSGGVDESASGWAFIGAAGQEQCEREQPRQQQSELSFMGMPEAGAAQQQSWADVSSPVPSARLRATAPSPQEPGSPSAWAPVPPDNLAARAEARRSAPLPSVYMLPPLSPPSLQRVSDAAEAGSQQPDAEPGAGRASGLVLGGAFSADLAEAAAEAALGLSGSAGGAGASGGGAVDVLISASSLQGWDVPVDSAASTLSPVAWQQPYDGQQLEGPLGLGDGLSAFQTLAQVVTLQSLLDQERAKSQDMDQQLQALRRRYKALSKLRQLENRRALMEGAAFQAHAAASGGGSRGRQVSVHVCYVEADCALRFVEEQAGTGGTAGGKEAASYTVPIASLAKVELGSALFPKGAGGGGWSRLSNLLQATLSLPRASRSTLDSADMATGQGTGGGAQAGGTPQPDAASPDSKCLTLVLSEGASGGGGEAGDGRLGAGASAGGGVTVDGKSKQSGAWLKVNNMIHLQLPDKGNGRSRDEWAHGFMDLLQLGKTLTRAPQQQPG